MRFYALMNRSHLLLAALLALTACETMPWEETRAAPEPLLTAPSNIEAGESVTVQPGDTVYSIARRYKVPMRDVIALNQLRPPFQLNAGANILLPAKEIMVAPQARKKAPVREAVAADTAPTSILAPEPPAADTEAKSGVTVYRQEASPRQMVESGEEKETVLYAAPNRSAMASLAEDSAKKPVIIEGDGKAAAVAQHLELQPLQYNKGKAELKAPVFSNQVARGMNPTKGRFMWPVRGPVSSTFGTKAGGMRNDGVNIAASFGTPVAASDGGTVAYAGSEIPGYGNVVLIRHPDGFMTTYAHLERILVDRDTVAAKGDVIGTVGTSGGLATPQLHFEIRKGAEAVDPAKYLAH